MWEAWESLALGNLELFTASARRWLTDRSELRARTIDNADWPEIYEHFLQQARQQIDQHNDSCDRKADEDSGTFLQRMAIVETKKVMTESKWSDYDVCDKCDAGAGQPCVSTRGQHIGEVVQKAHSDRPKLGAAQPTQEAPAEAPAKATRAKRQTAATGQTGHRMTITPEVYGGFDTFKATCSCGGLNGGNYTGRDAAEKEFERHERNALVSA